MSIFNTYEGDAHSVYEGLSEQRTYPDTDARYLVEIVSLTSGHSQNPKNRGKLFAAAELLVRRVLREGEVFAQGRESSVISEGSTIAFHAWLPTQSNPELMTDAERYAIRDVMSLAAGAIDLDTKYMDFATAGEIFEDDGAFVQGNLLIVDYRATNGRDGMVFFNPSFYPADDEGELIKGKTPEELGLIGS